MTEERKQKPIIFLACVVRGIDQVLNKIVERERNEQSPGQRNKEKYGIALSDTYIHKEIVKIIERKTH